MLLYTVLSVVIIAGACEGRETESIFFPVKEIQDCFEKGLDASLNTFCFSEGCVLSKTMDVVVPCLKLGYDLLYENSTYSQNGDKKVYRTAQCAIEKCAEGIKNNNQPGAGGYFQACLYGMRSCVKRPKVEL